MKENDITFNFNQSCNQNHFDSLMEQLKYSNPKIPISKDLLKRYILLKLPTLNNIDIDNLVNDLITFKCPERAKLSPIKKDGLNNFRTYVIEQINSHQPNDNFMCADLEGINLSGLNLDYFNFNGCNIANADLSNTTLSHAYLNYTILTNANLTQATLYCTFLCSTILDNAILKNVNFNGIQNTKKTPIQCNNADFTDANLINYPGIETSNWIGSNFTNAHIIEMNLNDEIISKIFFTLGEKYISLQTSGQIRDLYSLALALYSISTLKFKNKSNVQLIITYKLISMIKFKTITPTYKNYCIVFLLTNILEINNEFKNTKEYIVINNAIKEFEKYTTIFDYKKRTSFLDISINTQS